MKISDLVDAGLTCPSCDSKHIRGAYHDWHNMDAFICSDCGLRWQEDEHEGTKILRNIKRRTEQNTMDTRFIWVMSTAGFPFNILLNPKSSDEVSLKEFLKVLDSSNQTIMEGNEE